MEHKGTVILQSQRLLLRPLRIEDRDAMFRNWASDPEVTRFLRWPAHRDPSVTEWVLTDWAEKYKDPGFYLWGIVPRDLGEPIGTISVVDLKEETDTVHIGYCIGKKWWHRGYTTEAFLTVIPFLFDQVKANRIETQHDPRNFRSGAVMCNCGLTYEGTLRQADFSNRGIVDAAMYSILESEYRERGCTPQPNFTAPLYGSAGNIGDLHRNSDSMTCVNEDVLLDGQFREFHTETKEGEMRIYQWVPPEDRKGR